MSHAPQQQPIHHKDGYHYYVKQYIENHMNEIVDVVGFRGGWERWLQIELARTINAEWHQPVLCEQRIWNNGQIDLWAKAARPEDKVPFVGIELKCRTALEEGNQFANRFHEDLKKIAKRPNDENTPCFLYATALGYKVDTETLYLNVRDPNNNQPIPIYYEEVMPGAFLIYTWVEHKGTKPSGVVRKSRI